MVKSLTDLPPNIIMEILCRLPLMTLFICRCVCKTFLHLTTPNPHFHALRSSRAPQALIIQFGDSVKPSRLLHLIDPELDFARAFARNFLLKPIFQMPKIQKMNMVMYRSSYREENKLVLMNSCNGLLYLAKRSGPDERSIVCNPVTNEYFVVPDVHDRNRSESRTTTSMWLGFSSDANTYKVLRIFYTSHGESRFIGAEVHMVGTGSWRDIDDKPLWHDHSSNSCSAYLDGVIYWFSNIGELKGILSFDFQKEIFGAIMLPAEVWGEEGKNTDCMSIGVLGGCLCVSYNAYHADHLDIWSMRKRGDQESWSKDFVIKTVGVKPRGRPLYGLFRPLHVLSNGEIVLLWMDNDLICYDPKSKSLKFLGFGWLNLHPKAVAFVPSLVPLKDALSVDKVIVQSVRPSSDQFDL